jgi:hypothetical protein
LKVYYTVKFIVKVLFKYCCKIKSWWCSHWSCVYFISVMLVWGCGIAQVVGHWLTVMEQLLVQICLCEIHDRWTGTFVLFFPNFFGFHLQIMIPSLLRIHLSVAHWCPVAMTRQHIIISFVFIVGTSSLIIHLTGHLTGNLRFFKLLLDLEIMSNLPFLLCMGLHC